MKNWFLVFVGMAFADILWAGYFLAVSKKNKNLAAAMSGGIILVGSTVTVEYVHNPALRWSATLGAAFGTYLVLHFNEWKERRESASK